MPRGFRRNPAGFTKLATGPAVSKHMRFVANYWRVILVARATVLFKRNTGEYTSSLTVDLQQKRIADLVRIGAILGAHVRYAAALEYGNSVTQDPPRPLTDVLDSMHRADPRHGKPRR